MNLKAELDLSGKVIIKVQLDDDIRRIPIHNDAITYDELVLMMQRIFNGKLSPSDDITIKYKDEDGDLITINDSSDLSFAIQCSRLLKLIILIIKPETQNDNTKGNLNKTEIVVLKTQLRGIRDQVNKLLDSLDVSPLTNSNEVSKDNQESEISIAPTIKDVFVAKANSSEFDPLQDKKPEVAKEPVQNTQNNRESEKRSHSVPVQQPPPVPASGSAPAQSQQISDYYAQTSNADYSKYMTQQYAHPQYTLPYDSMRGYPPTYMTSAPHTINYSSQQPQQQNYAVASSEYSGQPQGNPYSKNYSQAPLQHNYIQPR